MVDTGKYVIDEEVTEKGKLILLNRIKIGMYATMCCRYDMYRINTYEDIEYIIENAENNYLIGSFEEIDKLSC